MRAFPLHPRLCVALRAAALILLLPGCAALRRPEPPVDRSEDARILRDVEARLEREPSIELGTVRVEVDGRVVLLHGSVRGLGAWQCAIRNAQLVSGVATVVDYLVLERGPRDVGCVGSTRAGVAPPAGVRGTAS